MDEVNIPEISCTELLTAVEAGNRIQLIDLRSSAKVAGGRIDIVRADDFHNMPGSTLLSLRTLEGLPVDLAAPTVLVCSKGNDSRIVAQHLNALGARTRSLTGGMRAWMTVCLPRTLPTPPSLDHFIQFDRVGKGALSYLLISAGEALIVDPSRDFHPYLSSIERHHARLVGVADTHVHADYISGATDLSRHMHVPYYLHPADAIYPYDDTRGRLDFHPLQDGEEIPMGRCRINVVHTPGHSPGSVSYLIDGKAALTGDFLFVASVGRPDLAAKTEAWAALLWKSIQVAKQHWPPDLMVYPAHYGTQAERRADRTVGAVLAKLLQKNESLRKTSESEFIAWVKQKESAFPDAYKTMKAINVGLAQAGGDEADELEFGKNECSIG